MFAAKIIHRLTFANVMSLLALFIALGGASYAAIKVPANSVGTKQVKNRAITAPKLDRRVLSSLRGPQGLRGAQGAQGAQGIQGPKGDPGAAGAAALGDGSVTTSKLANSSVTAAKLGLATGVASTGVNPDANKSAAAHCPAGTSIISGAVEVVDQNGYALNGVAAVSYSGPVSFSGEYWMGTAYRTTGSASYGLTVIAFCTKA